MSGDAIVIDWGTTNFRAWLLAADGRVLDEIPEGKGLRALAAGEFADYCRSRVGAWRDGGGKALPVYMAGMVGSAQGWRLAPQLALPLTVERLAAGLMPVAEMEDAWIVPGARHEDGRGGVDVMRGEEVQIFGALALAGADRGVLCLPGTHSKWATVEDGRLVAFATHMTGEVYDAVLGHTILGRPADRSAGFSEAAFERGLKRAREPGGLLHHLFSARALHLYGHLEAAEIPSYLSGLAIGQEIEGARALGTDGDAVLLVSSPALRAPYERALRANGIAARWIDGREATREGVRAVMRHHRAATPPPRRPA